MLRLISSILFPASCSGCGRVVDHGPMCAACLMTLPRTGVHLSAVNRVAGMLANGVAPPGIAAAWFRYDPAGREADFIRMAKYDGRPRQARALGRIFASELVADTALAAAAGVSTIGDVDVLLPVPLHFTRRLTRGYNQAEEIARGISDVTGIPVGDNLIATAAHSTQTALGSEARRRNIAGCYALRHPAEIDGLHVAIVDDIITSGATIAECVLAISMSGARPSAIGAIALGLAGIR